MTLIEFDNAAKAILFQAGMTGITVQTECILTTNRLGQKEYHYKLTAHPDSGMVASWTNGMPYECNNPTLALERFQIAVDRRLAPPSEPEAITEIDGMEESVVDAPQPESEVGNG